MNFKEAAAGKLPQVSAVCMQCYIYINQMPVLCKKGMYRGTWSQRELQFSASQKQPECVYLKKKKKASTAPAEDDKQ